MNFRLPNDILRTRPTSLEFEPTGAHLAQDKGRQQWQKYFMDVAETASQNGPFAFALGKLVGLSQDASKKKALLLTIIPGSVGQ